MKIRTPKTSALLLGIAATAVFACNSVKASSFASGVTNNNGTIQFYLNQTADFNGVSVLFDNGSVSNLLVGATNAGLQSFALSTHTNYQIYVTSTGNGSPVQLSSDANTDSSFGSPRGVATVYNPSIGYEFGRIYVDNSSTAGKGKGIFMMNADQSPSPLGLGPFTTGVWNASSSSPYRMYDNDDGTLYVGDFSTAQATVWQFDPNLNKFTNEVLAIASETGGLSAGTHGDIAGEPVALGSVSKGNLVLFTADPGLAAGTTATNGSGPPTLGYQTAKGTFNNLYRYTIGANPLPYTNAPDLAIGLGLGSIAELTIDVAVHKQTGNIYGMFYRANYAAPCLQVFSPNGQQQLFTSLPSNLVNIGPDPLINAYVISISPDGLYVAIMNVVNAIYVMNITNGVPDLSSLITINNTPAVGNARGLCWDVADNVYTVSSGQGLLRIYSLGNSSTTIYGNDTTGTNGTFKLELPPITANIAATTNYASQNYGTAIPGTFTITLNTNVLTAPLVVNFVLGGTAINGTNYISSATNMVTFPAGTSPSGNWSTNILITPTAIPVSGPVTTVTCKVTGGAAYLAVPKLIDAVTIANTGPQSFSISPVLPQSPPITSVLGNTNISIYRGVPTDFAPLVITRLGDTNGPGHGVATAITLTNFVYGGTAVFGVDYKAGVQTGITPVNGTGSVTFAAGDISKQVVFGNPVPTPVGAPAVGEKSITIALGIGAPSQEGFTYSVTGGAASFVELDNSFGPEVVLYSNPMTNSSDSTNWTLTFASTNLGATTVLPFITTNYNNISPATGGYGLDGGGTNDFDVDFAYAVANDSIGQSLTMAASNWTTALKMTVNKDGNVAAAAGVNVYPHGQNFYGNYALRFNMMLLEGTYTGNNAPSAEFATFGIDHYGTNCNWIGADVVSGRGSSTTNADGSWAAIASDQGAAPGGTPADLALYDGAKALPNTGFIETVSAVENTFSNVYRHPTPFTATGIGSPANVGDQAANTWVDVELKQFQNTFTLSVNKSVILTFANTNVFTNGTVMLGYDDPFANTGDVGAAYYSNVRVVELAPFVSTNPVSLVLAPGATANFSVGATGTAPFTNQLYLSNGPVAVGSPIKVSTATNSATLSIPSVTVANATNYFVVISDIAGSVTSAVASVTLVTSPPTVTTNADVTVTLAPVLTGPVPAGLSYFWYTNGVLLTNSAGHIGGATTGGLVITNAQPSDSLVYTFVVSNAVSAVTNTATLSVVVPTPPTFTGITYNKTNAVLQFTSTDIYDITSSFNLQSSTVVTGPYTNTPATITFTNGTYQIILPQTNATEFYRLMHK